MAQLVEWLPPTPEIHVLNPGIGKLKEHLFTVNCVEKTKIKKIEAGEWPIFKDWELKFELNFRILQVRLLGQLLWRDLRVVGICGRSKAQPRCPLLRRIYDPLSRCQGNPEPQVSLDYVFAAHLQQTKNFLRSNC